jgi:nitroreductase
LSDDQIRELVRIGTTAPTSFHLQNWRFIAVRTPEAKARLSPIAWNQPAITEAAVTFIVCGQLADSNVIPERLAPVVGFGGVRCIWRRATRATPPSRSPKRC